MNAAIRKAIAKHITSFEALKEEIETIRDEEQEKFDNMPGGLQEADAGTKMEEGISNLDEAISHIDELIYSLEQASE